MAEIKNIFLHLNKMPLNKIRSFFSDGQGSLRAIISENGLVLYHIEDEKIKQKIEIDLEEKQTLFEYLHKFPRLPLDIIISSNTMSCRSISLNNLREKDMEVLAKNILNGKNGLINLVCYEKKFSYRTGVATLCNMKLATDLSKILQELLNIGNPIRATITSPLWIIRSYFKTHPAEKGKFEAQIFAVNSKFNKEVIALHDSKYVYYKQSITEDFNEKSAIEDAIKFVNQVFNTNMENMAIYKFDDATVDTFTTNLDADMKMISQSGNYIIANKAINLNFATKSISLLFLSILTVRTISDIVKSFDYNNKIRKIKRTTNSVDAAVMNEIALWENLNDYIFLKPLNFRSKLAEKFKTTHKKFQNISIKIDKKTKQPIFSTIYDDD